MYDPDSIAFQNVQRVMASGDMTGHDRPMARVSYLKRRIRSHRSNRPGPWRNLLFPYDNYVPPGSGPGQGVLRAGLPAVQTMTISRSLDSDSATASITFINDYMRRDYYEPEGADSGVGRPGYFTPDRGGNDLTEYQAMYSIGVFNQRDNSGDMTRGQLSSVVVRILSFAGHPPPQEVDNNFDDIEGTTHQENINRLAEASIVIGDGGSFRPNNLATRGQAASFAVRSIEWALNETLPASPIGTFPDIEGTTHEDNILKAHAAGIMVGFANGTFQPGRAISRIQGAKVAYRMGEYLEADVPPLIREYPSEYGDGDQFETQWGYPKNHAYSLLQPNLIVITYQGYGSDNLNELGQERYIHQESYVPPHEDTKLMQTGVWLIDSVNYGTDGTISIECRDMAKLLLEQMVYPPMIPMERFPLTYSPPGEVEELEATVEGSRPVSTSLSGSSNDPHVGWDGSIYGHRPSHAFDRKDDTYWLSVGNSGPRFDSSFEWIQGETEGDNVDRIEVHPAYSGMTGYISVRENGNWQGSSVVPYVPGSGDVPNGSDIPYVAMIENMPARLQSIDLPRSYDADDIRICFTELANSGQGALPYRAGVRQFRGRLSTQDIITIPDAGEPGTISDWSDAVKELVSWAGLTWHDSLEPEDPLIGRTLSDDTPLRPWGDFEMLGAWPIEPTPSDFFLNKSFSEAIKQISDMLGCVFFIDSFGGAVFRHPNIFSGGNFLTDPFGEPLPSVYGALFNEGIYNQRDSSGNLNRGQMATVLVRMLEWLGYTPPAAGSDQFTDIETTVHRENINRLAEAGIALGDGTGMFHPHNDTQRGQAASFVVRAAEWMTGDPLDTPLSNPYVDIDGTTHETNILKAYEANLMVGFPSGTFRPGGSLTRYQSARVLYRLGDFDGASMPPIITQRDTVDGQISTAYSPYVKQWPIELHENSNLIDYSVSLDDSQLRSEILVIGESPDVGSDMPAGGIVLDGSGPSPMNFRSVLAGQTRLFQVPGDSTKLFRTEIECQRMAEMTALLTLFTYRRGSATALAHPGLMLDDQIRIFERITNERNVHYVTAITTEFDADAGSYTMDLTTHWLGKDPDAEWFLDELVLTDAIRQLPRIEERLAEAEG